MKEIICIYAGRQKGQGRYFVVAKIIIKKNK